MGDDKFILSDLKNTLVIDLEKQRELKNYIDNLVFVLYLNIPIDNDEINRPEIIRKKCLNNNYYTTVSGLDKKAKDKITKTNKR